MSTSDSSLPAYWQFYAERARQTHYGRVDDFGYGREELLWETLAVIQAGAPLTDDCRLRLDRIPWNRAKKHRRVRRFLLGRQSATGVEEASAVEVADTVDQVRCMLSPGEWEVECRLAASETYAEVALDCGLSPDTLKVRAGRWRARIRRKLALC